ncbi:hypothetical protein [Muricoccus radiodurans]|uniref:hypothetical protein n=1 Tax=Muricoccus radiodurans TaxID=2231721 RepID=UPI003CE7BE99
MPVEMSESGFAVLRGAPLSPSNAAPPPRTSSRHEPGAPAPSAPEDHPAMADLVETIARSRRWSGILRHLLGSGDPRNGFSLLARDLAVTFEEAARHGLDGAPWVVMREFTQWLHREKNGPVQALGFVQVMEDALADPTIAAGLDPALHAAIARAIQEDATALRRELAERALKSNDAHGDEQGSIAAAETLASLSRTPAEREHWMAIRRDRKRLARLERRYLAWIFLGFIPVCIVGSLIENDVRWGWDAYRSAARQAESQAANARYEDSRQAVLALTAPAPQEARPAKQQETPLNPREIRWCEAQRHRIAGARARREEMARAGIPSAPDWLRIGQRGAILEEEHSGACGSRRPRDAEAMRQIEAEMASAVPTLRAQGAQLYDAVVPARR